MSELDQVARLLAGRFSQNGEHGRIVFWRDIEGQYADDVESLVGKDSPNESLRAVQLVRLHNDPFNVRFRMFSREPKSKFLVYLTGEKSKPENNWLLDLELAYGPTFSADKLTMIATEVLPAVPRDTKECWLNAMREAPAFFEDGTRVDALAARLTSNDDERTFKAKMIAVLLGCAPGRHSLQDIWTALLRQYAENDDSGIDAIERMGLSDYHWSGTKEIYRFPFGDDADGDGNDAGNSGNAAEYPTVHDFVIWLFRLAWQGFVDDAGDAASYANIRRDFESWESNVHCRDMIQQLADEAADELNLNRMIPDMSIDELADRGIFRVVDDTLIHKLFEQLVNRSISDDRVQRIIDGRKMGLWYETNDYKNEYQLIRVASTLYRELDECTSLIDNITTPEQGFTWYRDRLYRVDQAYRRFEHARNETDDHDAATISNDLEDQYTAYQRTLGQAWQKQIDTLDRWAIPNVPAQTDFYRREVKHYTDSNKKLVVVISDALRYEVAQELSEQLNRKSRLNIHVDAQCAPLPSYTQLGMAALLPHGRLAMKPDLYHVQVDGRDTADTADRNAILEPVQGRAITADQWMELKHNEPRELIKSCSLLYIYHNHIDAIGDNAKTENDTFKACKEALEELERIIAKLTSANVTNIIVTADHGFLYQDHDVTGDEWLSEQPQGDDILTKKRRFTIGINLVTNPAFTTYTAAQIGLSNPVSEGVTIQIPNSILRLRKQGTGVRYVHGGAALPEIVVPVVHINKGRSSSGDARPVNLQILQKSDRLTSGQLTVEFVQNEPVGGKVTERTVYAGFWGIGKSGEPDTLISNEVPMSFDMTAADIGARHVAATFVLTPDAERFNGTTVELRLRESADKSGRRRVLDQPKARYLLKRGIIADDGFDFFD